MEATRNVRVAVYLLAEQALNTDSLPLLADVE